MLELKKKKEEKSRAAPEKTKELEIEEIQKHEDIKKIKGWKLFKKIRLKLLKKAELDPRQYKELNPRYFEEVISLKNIKQQVDLTRDISFGFDR